MKRNLIAAAYATGIVAFVYSMIQLILIMPTLPFGVQVAIVLGFAWAVIFTIARGMQSS